MIRRFTEHDVHIIDGAKDDMDVLLKAIIHAHVVVLRPGAEGFMFEMREKPEFKHLKWVMDIDDNTEYVSPYSIHYKEYGVAEFYDKLRGAWLWKDGESGFDLKKNKQRMHAFLTSLSQVDLITTTTPALAAYASQFNKHVAILPNCIDMERWWQLPLKRNKTPRIGWSGGMSHYEDWHSLKAVINKLLKEHQFTFVMAGQGFKGIIDKENQHLVETHDWTPFKGHSYRMMCMNLDAAIVPLADLPFNHYKSAVKWYEMSAMGIGSIVAYVGPYAPEITHNHTALAYQTADEFEKAVLRALQRDPAWYKVGKEAQEWVKTNRDAKKCVNLWTDAYQSIL